MKYGQNIGDLSRGSSSRTVKRTEIQLRDTIPEH